jgi:hypothetical protein
MDVNFCTRAFGGLDPDLEQRRTPARFTIIATAARLHVQSS